MKSVSNPEPGLRAVRGPRRPDLAARVRGRATTLCAHLGTREALADAIRQANASLEPGKIATWLVNEAAGWFGSSCWGVAAHDPQGRFAVLGDIGALRREAKRASRSGRPLSLLFLDLDGFKQVNDTHGHQAGSQALGEAATIIRGCARETDVVARFGGDEFSLILPETGQEGAVSVATRIRERLRTARFLTSEGLSLQLTVSIGVATVPDAAASADALLKAADTAMYRVKASGKDGIHIAIAN